MSDPAVTAEQISIMRHAIGGETNKEKQHRNFFVTYCEGHDGVLIQRLVDQGLMADHGVRKNMGGMNMYTVSEQGISFLKESDS